MEFDAHVFGALSLQKTDWGVPIERNLGIWAVMADTDIVFFREFNRFIEKL